MTLRNSTIALAIVSFACLMLSSGSASAAQDPGVGGANENRLETFGDDSHRNRYNQRQQPSYDQHRNHGRSGGHATHDRHRDYNRHRGHDHGYGHGHSYGHGHGHNYRPRWSFGWGSGYYNRGYGYGRHYGHSYGHRTAYGSHRGHKGYYCKSCHYQVPSISIFYRHLWSHHSIPWHEAAAAIVWNPTTFMYVFGH